MAQQTPDDEAIGWELARMAHAPVVEVVDGRTRINLSPAAPANKRTVQRRVKLGEQILGVTVPDRSAAASTLRGLLQRADAAWASHEERYAKLTACGDDPERDVLLLRRTATCWTIGGEIARLQSGADTAPSHATERAAELIAAADAIEQAARAIAQEQRYLRVASRIARDGSGNGVQGIIASPYPGRMLKTPRRKRRALPPRIVRALPLALDCPEAKQGSTEAIRRLLRNLADRMDSYYIKAAPIFVENVPRDESEDDESGSPEPWMYAFLWDGYSNYERLNDEVLNVALALTGQSKRDRFAEDWRAWTWRPEPTRDGALIGTVPSPTSSRVPRFSGKTASLGIDNPLAEPRKPQRAWVHPDAKQIGGPAWPSRAMAFGPECIPKVVTAGWRRSKDADQLLKSWGIDPAASHKDAQLRLRADFYSRNVGLAGAIAYVPQPPQTPTRRSPTGTEKSVGVKWPANPIKRLRAEYGQWQVSRTFDGWRDPTWERAAVGLRVWEQAGAPRPAESYSDAVKRAVAMLVAA